MKVAAAIWWSLIFGIPHASAFLGDDMVTVEREYEPPTFHAQSDWVFHSQQYRILVTFKAGKAAKEVISNFDKSQLTKEQVAALLQGQSGGKQWHENPPRDGLKNWDREGAVAVYDTSGDPAMLFVFSR